jgi:hypothetical protein
LEKFTSQKILLLLILLGIGSLPGRLNAGTLSDIDKIDDKSRSTTLTITTGYRVDDFKYNISGDNSGHNPNILSELSWKNLRSYEINGRFSTTLGKFLYMRGSADYAWIYSGTMQDSDYLGDNRTFEFSRSVNDSNDGTLLDSALGLGYPTKFTGEDNAGLVALPMVGYGYNVQRLRVTNGNQVIPPTGSFPGLDSGLHTQWWGPWVGTDFSWTWDQRFTFFGTYEYHWVNYRAVDNHNLRTDLQHPESIVFTSNGRGMTGTLGIGWALTRRYSVDLIGNLMDWSAGQGTDTTFFSNGTTATTAMNEAVWTSWSVSLGFNLYL